ncbi:MAG: hypothetical protein WKF79_13810, partial [Nocardioides sp.]
AGDDIAADALLSRIREAEDRGYSGYVETSGTLQVPAADRFSDVGALFGEQTRLRVWWRDADAWRVDRLLTAGETDLVHDARSTTEYDYEDAEARTSVDPDIRLPRTADLLPPALARRLLEDVDEQDATRLDARRIAGIAAPGLRLRPGSDRSSIDHVDLWADPESGIPLRVEVYAAGSARADFTSSFLDFSAERPDTDVVTFRPTSDTDVEFDDVLDIADAANQYAPIRPPREVAGLAISDSARGAVGVYGVGLTELIAIPLRDREADPLRKQVRVTPRAVEVDLGVTVSIGPLGVLLTGDDGDDGWLVTGTVTQATLEEAARDLIEGFVYIEDDR